MAPITTVTPQYPAAEPTDLGSAETDWSLTSGGGVNHDGSRKVPARFAAEIRAIARKVGFTTDTSASTTHEGRLKALEGGTGLSRTENMSALPAFTDRALIYPDAVTTDHRMDLTIASGKLRVTAPTTVTDNNVRRMFGHIPSGIIGDSEVRSTLAATSSNWNGQGKWQFGHVHRARVDRHILARGIVTSATSTTLSDSTQAWKTSPKEFAGAFQASREVMVKITHGTGAADAQFRKVINNTATQITVETAWSTTPDTTSYYEIYSYSVNAITCLIPVAFVSHSGLQFEAFDGTPIKAFGYADLTAYLGVLGSETALPWKMKSRLRGNTLDAVLWAASDTEPAYGTSGKSLSATIPGGYGEQPGLSGLYAGHISNTEYLEYDDMTITRV